MTSSDNQESTISADVKLSVAGQSLNLRLTVPVGQTKPTRLLPVLRSISESLVNAVESRARAEGFQVSCKKGCGACCRQLVPISETDARRLRELVAGMPEARKTAVLARFEDAKQRIGAAGLLERLRFPESIVGDEFKKFGLNYFHQGVACPFLEEESCSIHQERPLVCREYLVVSPPENCARQTNEPVQVLSMPAEVSMAARRLGRGADGLPVDHWVPLILALDWADAHGEEPSRPGPEIVKEIFAGLVKKELPPPSND